ncbi:MAG: hypothetical protein DI537_19210 [Stutzerimonas stutzeri]|nr:MAG: hypothetical protein DI537_19210 [Stutzerimonas stutzeri]
MTQVTIKHIRAAKLCASGTREFFAKHGLPWNEFLERGVPVEALEATGDALAFRVTAIARKEESDGRRGR